MKAVAIFEWEFGDDTDPAAWHAVIQGITTVLEMSGLQPLPHACGLAVEEVAQAVLDAFHGVEKPKPLLNESMDTLAKRGIVKG